MQRSPPSRAAMPGLTHGTRCWSPRPTNWCGERRVSDATWALLAARYGEEQLMDAVFLVGCYNTMAMLTMSFGIEVEAEAETDERLKHLRQYT